MDMHIFEQMKEWHTGLSHRYKILTFSMVPLAIAVASGTLAYLVHDASAMLQSGVHQPTNWEDLINFVRH